VFAYEARRKEIVQESVCRTKRDRKRSFEREFAYGSAEPEKKTSEGAYNPRGLDARRYGR
jgi:hypothetical protein